MTTAAELDRLARHLTEVPEFGLDTEGDSLHHYPERLALIQIGVPGQGVWLVDPLAIPDLGPVGRVFADARVGLVLHAGDNDLAHLKRRYGFVFASVFDTSLAARVLGMRALGLDVLLKHYLDVELPPSRQKDDWSVRPLRPDQERYAAADVEHLIPLKDRLVADLRERGRLHWVEEECAALAAAPLAEREVDPAPWARLKGARELGPRGLAILRELHGLREQLALALDRPPFKILSDATLVALAQAAPNDPTALGAIAGITPRVAGRWGRPILEAVGRALALSPAELPALPRGPRRPVILPIVTRRIEALREWRGEAAIRFDLDPGVLLPNRLIHVIAQAGPATLEALAAVEGVRRWRVEAIGAEIVGVIASIA